MAAVYLFVVFLSGFTKWEVQLLAERQQLKLYTRPEPPGLPNFWPLHEHMPCFDPVTFFERMYGLMVQCQFSDALGFLATHGGHRASAQTLPTQLGNDVSNSSCNGRI